MLNVNTCINRTKYFLYLRMTVSPVSIMLDVRYLLSDAFERCIFDLKTSGHAITYFNVIPAFYPSFHMIG